MDPTAKPIADQLKAISAGSRARHAAYAQAVDATYAARAQALETARSASEGKPGK